MNCLSFEIQPEILIVIRIDVLFADMKCPLCKGNMFTGTTILPFDLQNRRVVVVLNVSALICDQCGDEYVEMHVARRVEKILSDR